MKLKRYVASTMRAALAKVREEQGADVIIVSNRAVPGGVEIITAEDAEGAWDEEAVPPAAAVAAKAKPTPGGAHAKAGAPRPVALEQFTAVNQQPETALRPAQDAAWKQEEPVYPHKLRTGARAYAEPEPPAVPEPPAAAPAKAATARAGPGPRKLWSDVEIGNRAPPPRAQAASPAPIAEPSFHSYQEANREGAIVQVQQELQSLRGMLEKQMAGLAWANLELKHPVWAELMSRLLAFGFSPRLTRRLVERIPEEMGVDAAWARCVALLQEQLPIAPEHLFHEGGVAAFVGPSGVGKTTIIAKIAARYAIHFGAENVALLTTDDRRIGAQEQLRIFSKILGIPVWLVTGREAIGRVLDGLLGKRLVLIDTPGLSGGRRPAEAMQADLTDMPANIRKYLVCAANMQYATYEKMLREYGSMELDGCVLTKLDEAADLGPVLSFAIENQLGVSYVTAGQRIPEDLVIAKAYDLVRQALAEDENRSNQNASSLEEVLRSRASYEYI